MKCILRISLIAILICSFHSLANAQKDYARKVVDTLASPYMAGRGYVDSGCQKAEKYILDQYKSFGLSSFGLSYEQKFTLPVNTYPGKLIVTADGKLETDGADYIVSPVTPTIKGKFPIVKFDETVLSDSNRLKSFFSKDYRSTFILVDDGGNVTDKKEKELWEATRFNPFRAKGVIILTDKLTQETSDTVFDYALIFALRSTTLAKAKKINIDIGNKFIRNYPSANLVGYIKGSIQPDSFIVFTAHYDHLGKMDNIYFPGANDNASGVAMLLSLAKHYSQPQNQPKCSIAFIAFAAEEVDIRGSHYYNEHPVFPLNKIKFLVNMDIMGTGDEGITVVNANEYNKAYKDLVRINDSLHLLKEVKERGPTANSDHYFFYKNHVPDFFIYTLGGIKAYHDIYDRRETLPLTEFDNVFKLLVNFTNDICQSRF